ncbi:MAG: hypothetical protein CV088_16360 [Nitrospira sp. LK70]|nr:hypothetical protein [Nitrospira sp. LK70]
MTQLSRSVFLQVGTGVVLAWLVTGCATYEDLEMMNLNLTKKLDIQTTIIRAETGSLREQVKSSKTELENLRAQVGAFESALELLKQQEVTNTQILRELSTVAINTKKEMEGSDIRDQERFRRIEMMTGETTKQLQTAQQSFSDLSGRIKDVPSRVTALGTEVRSLTETLMENYELEEATLKDRLRLVEEMQKHFRPLQAYEAGGTSPEK